MLRLQINIQIAGSVHQGVLECFSREAVKRSRNQIHDYHAILGMMSNVESLNPLKAS